MHDRSWYDRQPDMGKMKHRAYYDVVVTRKQFIGNRLQTSDELIQRYWFEEDAKKRSRGRADHKTILQFTLVWYQKGGE